MKPNSTNPIRVLLVDDHVLFREGLISLLKNQPDFEMVGEAGSHCEAVKKALELEPNLVLMDYALPDGNGLEATQEILARLPETKIVFLTVHETDELLFAAIRSGAKGYLLKNMPVSKLLELLRGLGKGEAAITLKMASRILEEFARQEWKNQNGEPTLDLLTTRELEILEKIADGETNREIAARLYISENTVRNHVHNILEKLKLQNRYEAARLATRVRRTRDPAAVSLSMATED
ncbi:MAG TPA: response regulator transcription factor [Anaerolineales bacterium]|jgi:DNA-binding NarL/FixJ family response regulator|nr:response regulator transcription factor [Anaerolineales bacterium]